MALIDEIKTQHELEKDLSLNEMYFSNTLILRKALIDGHNGFSIVDGDKAMYFSPDTEKIDVSTYISINPSAKLEITMDSNGEQMLWPQDQSSILEVMTISGNIYALLPFNNKGRFILNVRRMGGIMDIDDNIAKLDLDVYTIKFFNVESVEALKNMHVVLTRDWRNDL